MPRPTIWIDSRIGIAPTSGGSANSSLFGALSPTELTRSTITRMLIRLEFVSETVAGAWGVQLADVGIGITSQEAFAASTLPDPSVAGDKPSRGWLYRNQIMVSQNGISTDMKTTVVADIRSQRKVDDGELFIIVDSTALLGTSFTMQMRGMIRTLVRLP